MPVGIEFNIDFVLINRLYQYLTKDKVKEKIQRFTFMGYLDVINITEYHKYPVHWYVIK